MSEVTHSSRTNQARRFRAWNGSWNGPPHNPNAASAASAMFDAICAASACAVRSRASRNAQVGSLGAAQPVCVSHEAGSPEPTGLISGRLTMPAISNACRTEAPRLCTISAWARNTCGRFCAAARAGLAARHPSLMAVTAPAPHPGPAVTVHRPRPARPPEPSPVASAPPARLLRSLAWRAAGQGGCPGCAGTPRRAAWRPRRRRCAVTVGPGMGGAAVPVRDGGHHPGLVPRVVLPAH